MSSFMPHFLITTPAVLDHFNLSALLIAPLPPHTRSVYMIIISIMKRLHYLKKNNLLTVKHHLTCNCWNILHKHNCTDIFVFRLYSDYLFITGKHTAKGFHSKVKHAIQLYKNCMKHLSPRDCLYDYKISMKSEVIN